MDIIGRQIDWCFRDRIPEVRDAFKERIEQLEDVDLVYKEDIAKTMTEDFWVEKFLEWHRGSVTKAADGLIFSLKYQKRYKVRELKDSDFAAEPYSFGSFFEYEPDRLGRKTIYIRMKYSPACKETREISIQFMLYQNFKRQNQCGETEYITIHDFRGMTMNNIDLKFIPRAMDLLEVFPLASPLAVAVNFPPAIRVIFNGFLYAIPVDQRKGILIVNQEQLQEVVAIENLPDFLGGTCIKPYYGETLVPEGCHPMREHFLASGAAKSSNEDNEDFKVENGFKYPSPELIEKMKNSPLIWPQDFNLKKAQRVISYYESILTLNGSS